MTPKGPSRASGPKPRTDCYQWCVAQIVICRCVGGMVAAAGALEMTGGQRAEPGRLARSHTAPAREAGQAKVVLSAASG